MAVLVLAERVRVYRNLHKKCWSIQHKTPKGWRLKEHKEDLFLANCTFIVREGGRQKVIREQKKNVHAFIEGNLVIGLSLEKSEYLGKISYNPYQAGFFFWKESADGPDAYGEAIIEVDEQRAKLLRLTNKGVEVRSPWSLVKTR